MWYSEFFLSYTKDKKKVITAAEKNPEFPPGEKKSSLDLIRTKTSNKVTHLTDLGQKRFRMRSHQEFVLGGQRSDLFSVAFEQFGSERVLGLDFKFQSLVAFFQVIEPKQK